MKRTILPVAIYCLLALSSQAMAELPETTLKLPVTIDTDNRPEAATDVAPTETLEQLENKTAEILATAAERTAEAPATSEPPAPEPVTSTESSAPGAAADKATAGKRMAGGGKKTCKGKHGKGKGHGHRKHGHGKHQEVVQRLDMIEARLAKIESMLESLVRR